MKRRIIIFLYLCIFLYIQNGSAQYVQSYFRENNSGIASNYVLGGVTVDSENNLWSGTDSGVSKFDGNSWTTYNTQNSDGLADNYITCIAVDSEDNIWVGTEGFGVSMFDGAVWKTYTTADGLCDNGIYSISADNSGSVWFGSYGSGVCLFKNDTWTTYTSELPLDNGITASVNAIFCDNQSAVWFATTKGLCRFKDNTFMTINKTTTDSLIEESIISVYADNMNNKWLGTLNGMTQLDAQNNWVKNYRKADGLYNDAVRDITADTDNNLWFGLYTSYDYNGGVSVYNGTTWNSTSFSFPEDSSANQIFSITADLNNAIWVATDYGLVKFTNSTDILKFNSEKKLKIYPNPVSDYLYIDLYENSGNDTNIEIFSNNKLIRTIPVQNSALNYRISVTNLPSGLYLLKYGISFVKFQILK